MRDNCGTSTAQDYWIFISGKGPLTASPQNHQQILPLFKVSQNQTCSAPPSGCSEPCPEIPCLHPRKLCWIKTPAFPQGHWIVGIREFRALHQKFRSWSLTEHLGDGLSESRVVGAEKRNNQRMKISFTSTRSGQALSLPAPSSPLLHTLLEFVISPTFQDEVLTKEDEFLVSGGRCQVKYYTLCFYVYSPPAWSVLSEAWKSRWCPFNIWKILIY